MTKRQALNDLCKLYNLQIEVSSPGDGRSRYNFTKLNGSRILYHALGVTEALAFARGYGNGIEDAN